MDGERFPGPLDVRRDETRFFTLPHEWECFEKLVRRLVLPDVGQEFLCFVSKHTPQVRLSWKQETVSPLYDSIFHSGIRNKTSVQSGSDFGVIFRWRRHHARIHVQNQQEERDF